MASPNVIVSRDASDRLREWSDEFRSALVLAPFISWVEKYGRLRVTNALRTTFPIPIDAAGYKELVGDITFRKLYARSLTMTSKQWFDAIQAKARIVESDEFMDWSGAPARMAFEWQRYPQVRAAIMLALNSFAGPQLDFYRDPDSQTVTARNLFAADHPFNVLDSTVGSFDNTMSFTRSQIKDGTMVQSINDRFRLIKGPNGQDLGLTMQGGSFLTPSVFDNDFKELLEQDTLIRAVQNVGKTENVAGVIQKNIWGKSYGVNYDVGVELSRPAAGGANGDYLYALAAPKAGLVPWVAQQGSAPEEILHDKTSELYKRSQQIGVSYVGEFNIAGCLPHPIIRVKITDSNP